MMDVFTDLAIEGSLVVKAFWKEFLMMDVFTDLAIEGSLVVKAFWKESDRAG
jgi:hypothetical protein